VAREDYEDGLHREFEIMTQSVKVWHVSEYSRHRVDPVSHGQFHDEDAYVVCWRYAVTQSKNLSFTHDASTAREYWRASVKDYRISSSWYNALTLDVTVVTKATPAIKHSLIELKKISKFF